MASPAAEVDIDEALVRSLLAAQHPDLAELPLRMLDAGWDNASWRLGDELVVRLPRRAVAVELLEREQRWLAELAPALPLPVPVPVRVGVPSDLFAWPWSVVPWLPGEPADRAAISDADGTAGKLAAFMRALHRPAPFEAPRSTFRGVPLATRAAVFDERLDALAREVDTRAVRATWNDAVRAPLGPDPTVWIHGDLHPANMLIASGTLAAVIDFGDLCAGDPATDLAAAWMLLPTPSVATFLTAYGASDALVCRARGWAALFGLMLLAIGLDAAPFGKPSYERVGRATLARATATLR